MSRKTETELMVASAGRGASPEGERSDLPSARCSRARTRFAIASPTR
jgi:hypothetical protein